MVHEGRLPTRMGDGTFAWLSRSEIRADLESGSVKAIPWDEARQMISGGT